MGKVVWKCKGVVGGWVGLSVIGCRLSVVGYRLSVVGCRLSVIGYRLWVVGCRLSVVGSRSRGAELGRDKVNIEHFNISFDPTPPPGSRQPITDNRQPI